MKDAETIEKELRELIEELAEFTKISEWGNLPNIFEIKEKTCEIKEKCDELIRFLMEEI